MSAAAVEIQPVATDDADAQLIAGILAGEGDAFTALHAKYHTRIYSFALKRLRDPCEAEDVTQETFLQVHRSLASYEGRSTLLSWMFGIAHNQVRRRFRRPTPPSVSLDTPEAAALCTGEESTDRKVDLGRVLSRCDRIVEKDLSEGQQKIFRLRYIESQSTRQIANHLGKSTQAVKISLFRSRRALAQRTPELHQVLSA
jgi:RNA polymerase sigma-70 factor (ECF subfamily)